MYIEDAVSAYLALASKVTDSSVRGQAFNFGSNRPISVIQLFDMIAKLCGKSKLKPRIFDVAKNEIDCQYLASGKARKILNWAPKYSIEEGLKLTIGWYRDYLNP